MQLRMCFILWIVDCCTLYCSKLLLVFECWFELTVTIVWTATSFHGGSRLIRQRLCKSNTVSELCTANNEYERESTSVDKRTNKFDGFTVIFSLPVSRCNAVLDVRWKKNSWRPIRKICLAQTNVSTYSLSGFFCLLYGQWSNDQMEVAENKLNSSNLHYNESPDRTVRSWKLVVGTRQNGNLKKWLFVVRLDEAFCRLTRNDDYASNTNTCICLAEFSAREKEKEKKRAHLLQTISYRSAGVLEHCSLPSFIFEVDVFMKSFILKGSFPF